MHFFTEKSHIIAEKQHSWTSKLCYILIVLRVEVRRCYYDIDESNDEFIQAIYYFGGIICIFVLRFSLNFYIDLLRKGRKTFLMDNRPIREEKSGKKGSRNQSLPNERTNMITDELLQKSGDGIDASIGKNLNRVPSIPSYAANSSSEAKD